MKLLDKLFSSGGCYICHRDLKLKNGICPQCLSSMNLINKEIGERFPYLDAAYFLMEYTNLSRQVIKRMKYKEEVYFAKVFGDFMVDFIKIQELMGKIDCITFVPMTKKKKIFRGYNQSELIAKRISNKLDLACENLLVKTREGKDQIGLNSQERFSNVKNSFQSSSQAFGKRILLVDDVFTTGSTIMDCSRALKQARAEQVIALVITKADYIDRNK